MTPSQPARRPVVCWPRCIPLAWHLPPLPEGVPTQPGVLALAETLVSCDILAWPTCRPAAGPHAHCPRPGVGPGSRRSHPRFRLVTLQGELLEAGRHTDHRDPPRRDRHSVAQEANLRELRDQVAQLDRHMAETDRDLAELRTTWPSWTPRPRDSSRISTPGRTGGRPAFAHRPASSAARGFARGGGPQPQ